MAGVGFLLSLWEEPIWEVVWLHLDPMDSVCLRTASMEWNVPGSRGRMASSFFLMQKEPATVPGSETFSPFFAADIRSSYVSADVLKKCALIALRVIAEEGRGEDVGCRARGLGDEGEFGCPKSPIWESEDEAWSEDESVSSSGSREGNVCNEALRVVWLCGLGDTISLFLKDWELAKVALSCHMALDMLCQEMHEAWLLGDATWRPAVSAWNAFSRRGRA